MTILRCFLSHKRWQMQVSVGISGQEMSKFQVVGILGNKKHQCQHVHCSLKPTIHPSKTCGFVQRLSGFSSLVSKVPSPSYCGTVTWKFSTRTARFSYSRKLSFIQVSMHDPSTLAFDVEKRWVKWRCWWQPEIRRENPPGMVLKTLEI